MKKHWAFVEQQHPGCQSAWLLPGPPDQLGISGGTAVARVGETWFAFIEHGWMLRDHAELIGFWPTTEAARKARRAAMPRFR